VFCQCDNDCFTPTDIFDRQCFSFQFKLFGSRKTFIASVPADEIVQWHQKESSSKEIAVRVTIRACEKVAQNECRPTSILSKSIHNFYRGKKMPHYLGNEMSL
jgi:hypothetical protein